MSNRYALVDSGGLVVNIVEWDGETDWSPPAGLTATEADPTISKGWRRVDDAWVAPEEEEEPQWT